MTTPLHLGWFVEGFRPPGWMRGRQFSGTAERDWSDAEFFIDWAKAMERACFDFFLCSTSSLISDVFEGSMRVPLKFASPVPKHDPTAVLPLIAKATSKIGLAATLTTTEWFPFQLARYVATLDRLSNGRAGWNIVTGSNDRAAQNYGFDAQPDHDLRYDMADEFVEIVTKLWNSWEPDAVVMDEDSGVYTDYTKVHPINYVGKYYKCRGPLDTSPTPQGRPAIIQAGGSGRGREFAARWSDLIITTQGPIEHMKAYRDDVHKRLLGYGRKTDDCKVVFICNPIIGDTNEEAEDRAARYRAEQQSNLEPMLADLAMVTGVDFSRFNYDEPLPPDVRSNGHQSMLDFIARSGKPLREIMAASLDPGKLVGTPDKVAGLMGEMAQEIGGDGFMFCRQAVTRRYVHEITDGLVPALQRRGLARKSYAHSHFRDHLKEF